MSIKLNPCVMCGGEAERIQSVYCYFVWCPRCERQTELPCSSDEDATSAWNAANPKEDAK